MHHRLDLRIELVNLQVQQNLAGTLLPSRHLFAGHIHHTYVIGLHETLAYQRRRAQDLVLADAIGNIPVIGSGKSLIINLPADLADFFLDHEFVEFVAAIPSKFKTHKLTTKYLLKEAMKPLLPAEIVERRKHGFGVPLGEWFKNELKAYAKEVFWDPATVQRGLFKTPYIQTLLDEHQKGLRDYSPQLWALLIFELWCREYLDKK